MTVKKQMLLWNHSLGSETFGARKFNAVFMGDALNNFLKNNKGNFPTGKELKIP